MRSRLRPSQTFQIVSLVLGQHDADRRLGSRHAAIVRPTAPGATFPPPSTRGRTSGDLYLVLLLGLEPLATDEHLLRVLTAEPHSSRSAQGLNSSRFEELRYRS